MQRYSSVETVYKYVLLKTGTASYNQLRIGWVPESQSERPDKADICLF